MTPLEIGIALHYWVSPEPYKDGKNSWTEIEAATITKMHSRNLLEYQNGVLSGNTPAMRAFVEALEAVPWPTMKWVVEPCPVLEEGCHRSHPHENMNVSCLAQTAMAKANAQRR